MKNNFLSLQIVHLPIPEGSTTGRQVFNSKFLIDSMCGIFGLGYEVSAPDIITPIKTGSHYEDGRYVREKGNSVLAMIEETGFIGLLLFLLPIILLIRKFKIQNSPVGMASQKFKIVSDHYTFYIVNCTLLAMFIHAQLEAWWVGVGSISLPLYLIILFTASLPEKS